MNRVWVAAIIIAGTVTLGGCVSDRKYQEALAETEAAKTELATTRAQKSALEQQVKTLKDLNVKFGNEAQAARDELERIQYGRDKERGSAETRTKELVYKARAGIKDVIGEMRGVIDTEAKFKAARMEMAKHVWAEYAGNNSQACRNCHVFTKEVLAKQKEMVRPIHATVIEGKATCIDCHKGVAHTAP